MHLPNYFLADLHASTPLSAALVGEACVTLKRNRERFLAPRSTEEITRVLSTVGAGWLAARSPFRQLALEQGPAQTGFSRATLARGLDHFFQELTRENLETLLVQELGHARRLDEMSENQAKSPRRLAMATGPELLVHIAAGNIPNPTLTSIVLGLLTRSAQFVKCATGGAFLPRLFAHSIYELDRKLGACLEIAEWQGGNAALESELFTHADCVTATGRDETLAAIRSRVPASTRFLGYGHRVSFAYVASGVLSETEAVPLAAAAAADVTAWDQLGCLSPHVVYVQTGGGVAPPQFAQLLADQLDVREQTEPRGPVPTETAAEIASRRALYEVRAAHSEATRLWTSARSTAWTVVFEDDPRFQTSCLHRFIYVKAVRDLTEALQQADAVRGKVATVGLAAPAEQARALATQLARWGVPRVCPLGQMQQPPLTWRHDGRPALGDLVTWTDWEQGPPGAA